jgi:beta-N-acetylhexosaminidase
VSIEQTHLTPADIEMLRHPFIGGVVIFSKNFTSKAQIKALIAEIKSLKDPQLLVCVDHEGGRVQRFKKDFTIIPPMHKLGELYDHHPELALDCAKACGYIIATELGEVGVDFSFTPVLDLDYGQSSVIGDRSFHHDPEIVSILAGSLIEGLAEAGMQAIGKHFPGHGFVVKDSHLELPQDSRDLSEIVQKDLLPFEDLHTQLAGMMTAHVLYQNVAPEIATFSPFWLKQVLREQIAYQGLIFSDDLLMKATDATGNISVRAHKALDAGCDVLLLCNSDAAVLALLADKSVTERKADLDYSRLYYQPSAQQHVYQDAIDLLNKQGLICHD